ncbi:MAG: 50S ribosomal protein L32 [Dethiobacter sp.]|jgi:large subunit ribosomal protein L32|nr:50S ribosomal protein L32 [Dethiobacter sp.]
MAVPKRRTSKTRRDKRRTHWKLEAPQLVACPQCHELKAQHRVCLRCGYYKNNKVITIKVKKQK